MAGWFSSIHLDELGAQVSGLTQSLGESAAKMGEELQETVNTLAAFELEDIGKAIQSVEEGITSQETKIQREAASLKQTEVKILPWETRVEKLAILSHGLMEKILSLSLEESNFTTPPPAIVVKSKETTKEDQQDKGIPDSERNPPATFPLERYSSVAVRMLSLDPNLAKVHSRLISHMSEKTFWYNYFSRIAALRADIEFEPLCEDLSKETSGTTTSEEYDKVSHGDTQSMTSLSALRNENETDRKSDDKKNDKDDDDDYSDLGDLDDLDGASDSSIDATLEAEIAAELGET